MNQVEGTLKCVAGGLLRCVRVCVWHKLCEIRFYYLRPCACASVSRCLEASNYCVQYDSRKILNILSYFVNVLLLSNCVRIRRI